MKVRQCLIIILKTYCCYRSILIVSEIRIGLSMLSDHKVRGRRVHLNHIECL